MGDKFSTQYVTEEPVNRKQITESGLRKEKNRGGKEGGGREEDWEGSTKGGRKRILNIFSTDAS